MSTRMVATMASRSGKTREARRKAFLREQQQMTLFDGPSEPAPGSSGSVANESPAPSSDTPSDQQSASSSQTANSQRSAFADDAAPKSDRIQSWPQVAPPVTVGVPGINMDDKITLRFLEFHKLNPEVYDLMRAAAHAEILEQQRESTRRLVEEGKKPKKLKIGSKALYERIRKTYGPLNNDFTSRYARLLDHNEVELKGLFEFRTCKGEKSQ